ncbi:MAG: hypothetical protein ACXWCX_26455 [Burkholderiales bacterium]
MSPIASSLHTLALVAAVSAAIPVHAQDKRAEYPRRPIRIVNSYGLFAPAGTPRRIIGTINAAVIEGMNSPDILKVLAADGAEAAAPATPEEFRAKFERDYAELEKLIEAANIKLQ